MHRLQNGLSMCLQNGFPRFSAERSHENVFKASGARGEKAKQVEDDKGKGFIVLLKSGICLPVLSLTSVNAASNGS